MPFFPDTDFFLHDNLDTSKQLGLELSGITTGTRRILTPPNANATLAALDVAQTFTALQTFKDTTFKVVDDADPTKTLLFSLGGAAANADLTLLWQGTADTIISFPPDEGNIALASLTGNNSWGGTQQFNVAGDYTSSLVIYNGNDPGAFEIFRILDDSGGGTWHLLSPAGGYTGLRNVVAPDASGTLALLGFAQTWTAIQTFNAESGVSYPKISANFSVTPNQVALSFADTGSAKTLTVDTEAGFAANRVVDLLDSSGVFALAGTLADPPSAGQMGRVNRTAQGAAITAVNLTNTTPAGMYQVTWTIETTTAGTGTGTIQLNVIGTDDVSSRTQSSALLSLATTGRDSGVFAVYLASGNITWTTTLVGTIGTSKYALRVRCLYLG